MKVKRLLWMSVCTIGFSSDGISGKIERNIDETIIYRRGTFKFVEKDDVLSTRPRDPSEDIEQLIGSKYDELLPSFPEESVLSPDGIDRRIPVENTKEWPYLLHSHLRMVYSDAAFGGSAVLVGPHHLLTAAHNVYRVKEKKWAQSVSVRLARNGNQAPFGAQKVAKIYTFEEWTKYKDPAYDIALLVLDDSIGCKTGYCGLLCLNDESLLTKVVNITGYPGDCGYTQMMTMSNEIGAIHPERFFYDIDTNQGQSGGGIWINEHGTSPYVVGVHTLGEGSRHIGNAGVRLSTGKFREIVNWISETLFIQKSASERTSAPPRPAAFPHSSENPFPRPLLSAPPPASTSSRGSRAAALDGGFLGGGAYQTPLFGQQVQAYGRPSFPGVGLSGSSLSGASAGARDEGWGGTRTPVQAPSRIPTGFYGGMSGLGAASAVRDAFEEDGNMIVAAPPPTALVTEEPTKKKAKPASSKKKEMSLYSLALEKGYNIGILRDDNKIARFIVKKINDAGESLKDIGAALGVQSVTVSKFISRETENSEKITEAVKAALAGERKGASFRKMVKSVLKADTVKKRKRSEKDGSSRKAKKQKL